jgi:UbiD family decarboxylases
MMGSEKRILYTLGVNSFEEIDERMNALMEEAMAERNGIIGKLKILPTLAQAAKWMPKISKKTAPCHEVIQLEPQLDKLPILKCWPEDGGRFITLPLVHTNCPATGLRNVGMYRMQVFSKNSTGMHWHKHKTGARHFEDFKGDKMPVAVTLGGDPVYSYAATAPLPDGIDEYLLAGFLRGKGVQLTKCLTQDIYVPADSDFVIEGYVSKKEEKVIEGPFGDHTGFYSLADYYPTFHVTCITHKKDAIYPATVVGVPPQEDKYIALATEKIFLTPIKFAIGPEIEDLYLPEEGVGHNFAVVKIKKDTQVKQ